MPRGMALLEVTDQMVQERHADPRLYEMLVGALARPGHAGADPCWWRPSFFLKALVHEGAGPVLDGCAVVRRAEGAVELVAFDLVEGGALCRRCRAGRPMCPAALPCCAASWAADLAGGAGRAAARGQPTRSPRWPPRPWRRTSTAGSARCAPPPRPVTPTPRRGPRRLRGLRARPVLRATAATTAPSPPTPTATTSWSATPPPA